MSLSNESHRRARSRLQDVAADFGALIDAGPKDPELFEECRLNLRRFLETHAANTFKSPWAKCHLEAIEKLEGVILRGRLYAMAFPRGFGKSSLCKWAVIWAILYGHSPYVVLIEATGKTATKELKSIKKILFTTQELLDQFPAAIAPVRHLSNEARRASQQHFRNELTHIEWEQQKIVLGHLDTKHNHGCEGVIETASIDGEIRGKQHTRVDGTIVRPTVSIVNDPQTRKSAKSPMQVDYREQIIMADVRYMAGDDQPNGIAVTCTIIYDDDLADRLTDPEKRPLFRGSRYKMMENFPDRMDLWETYADKQRLSFQNGGEGEEATDFYLKNREAMDAGAVMTWPERTYDCVSAVQYAMNCYFESEAAFQAECQNEPLKIFDDSQMELPSASDLVKRKATVKPKVIPDNTEKLTAFIDVGETVLWWVVVAWTQDFGGVVVDFGCFPDQKKAYVTRGTVRKKIADADVYKHLKIEDAVEQAVDDCLAMIVDMDFKTESGEPFEMNRIAVDSGHMAERIYKVVRRYRKHRVFAHKGIGITESRGWFIDPEKKPKSHESIEGQLAKNRKKRLVTFDTNHWKTFVIRRLMASVGGPGCLVFAKFSARKLQNICDQCSVEHAHRKFGHGRWLYVWGNEGYVDNHFWDGIVGCAVAAFCEGLSMKAATPERLPGPSKKRSGGKKRSGSKLSKRRAG